MGRRKKKAKTATSVATSDPNELPAKFNKDFRTIKTAYDAKLYKKALKAADNILKACPKHGETLTLKGIVVDAMGKKDDGEALIVAGVESNPTSFACWNYYGLFCKSHSMYTTAIKAFKNALKYAAPEHEMNMRYELMALYVQTERMEAFLDQANEALKIKSDVKRNWIALAIAYHLNANYSMALTVLDTFEDSTGGLEPWVQPADDPTAVPKAATSEIQLYKIMILIEGGEHARALAAMDAAETNIADKDQLLVFRAECYLALGQTAEAEAAYAKLIAINPENLEYHKGMLAAKGVTLADKPADMEPAALDSLHTTYATLAETYPKCNAVQDIILRFSRNVADYKTQLQVVLPKPLRKGTPSLFNRIAGVTTDPAHWGALEELVVSEYLPRAAAGTSMTGGDEAEPPSTHLWVLFFVAQLYQATHRSELALETINAAIAHTPTVVDLYAFKAVIYGQCGDHVTAVEWIEFARSLDLADRYLNTTAGKYLLAADMVPEAMDVVRLFTKDSDAYNSMFDMQTLWYELARGEAHVRRGELGPALKMFTFAMDAIDQYVTDQYEFHKYALRCFSIPIYIDMLRTFRAIHSDKRYATAALGACTIYLKLHEEAAAHAALPPAEARAASKAARAARKAQVEPIAGRMKVEANAGRQRKSTGKHPDTDPAGLAMASVENPLAKAANIVAKLTKFHPNDLDAHAIAVRIHLARNKPVLALRSLALLLALDPASPQALAARWRIEAAAINGSLLAECADDTTVVAFVNDRLAALPGGAHASLDALQAAGNTALANATALDDVIAIIDSLLTVVAMEPSADLKAALTRAVSAALAVQPVHTDAHVVLAAAVDLAGRLDPAGALAADIKAQAHAALPLCAAFV
ncbi:TPR Domain containing protein [Thecamonas trahens ATCC 50062]|uniref:TPR Domain containing protein n=1 Tax=Thecamonas trahens ATCC 50062 TaxID=461836 RepID=A0A0L0D9T9_THETB|nr:TPR Domain containing protein [Thecamonas trahens ATCC 50062]KNC49117.1 TPR Domain containing protein [Thecamonas trahens ATCC 50062]|eukprot:XP_013758145.1 TPR Domain containing protein [Thecamonas trahens ATCC 50062]